MGNGEPLSANVKNPLFPIVCFIDWCGLYIYIYIFTGHIIAIEGKHFHAVTNAILCPWPKNDHRVIKTIKVKMEVNLTVIRQKRWTIQDGY